MPALKPILVGAEFTRWTVIGPGPAQRKKNGKPMRTSLVRCIEGNEAIVQNGHLRSGHSRSCGCLRKDVSRELNTTHGCGKAGQRPRIYFCWHGMMQRTSNANSKAFKNYGGRGIVVCERWHSFENFLNDMGRGKPGWTLERIDNSKGYCLENCCWATRVRQCRNKRNNVVLTVRGITGCLIELCERFGVRFSLVRRRIALGWPTEKAFFDPSRRSRRQQPYLS